MLGACFVLVLTMPGRLYIQQTTMCTLHSPASVFVLMACYGGCTVENVLQAVPGSTQYEPRSLTEQEKENLLNSEGVALFLARVWPRFALASTKPVKGCTSCTLAGYS